VRTFRGRGRPRHTGAESAFSDFTEAVWDVLQWAALKGSADTEIQRSPTIKKMEISTGDR